MIPSAPQSALPMAFALKRHIARQRSRFWSAQDITRIPAAPVYLFPDSTKFDDDAVDALSAAVMDGPLHLPHEEVIFEVMMSVQTPGSLIAYATSREDHVAAFLFRYCRQKNAWTDVICRAAIHPNGMAEIEANPLITDYEEGTQYGSLLAGMVWRSLGLLSSQVSLAAKAVPVTRRPKLSKAGVTGWTYRIADIDLERIRATLPSRNGTHAPPRWHIRRGHWRQLQDGRRVFVRECEVSDQTRGGVVKDYRMDIRRAA